MLWSAVGQRVVGFWVEWLLRCKKRDVGALVSLFLTELVGALEMGAGVGDIGESVGDAGKNVGDAPSPPDVGHAPIA